MACGFLMLLMNLNQSNRGNDMSIDADMERQRERMQPEPPLDEREPATWDEICDYVWSHEDAVEMLSETMGELTDGDMLCLFDAMANGFKPEHQPSAKFAALIESRFKDAAFRRDEA